MSNDWLLFAALRSVSCDIQHEWGVITTVDASFEYSFIDGYFWISKRVEEASTDAAREVFGNNYESILEQVHVDDDAMVEGNWELCDF